MFIHIFLNLISDNKNNLIFAIKKYARLVHQLFSCKIESGLFYLDWHQLSTRFCDFYFFFFSFLDKITSIKCHSPLWCQWIVKQQSLNLLLMFLNKSTLSVVNAKDGQQTEFILLGSIIQNHILIKVLFPIV